MTLLSAARKLAPLIRDNSAAAEANQALPAELVQALRSNGMFGALLPGQIGGGAVSLPEYLGLVEELAAADGSTAWCVMIGATLTAMAAAFGSDAALAEVFPAGHGPGDVVFGGQTSPRAKVVRNGTLKISGEFRFGSGCTYADWLLCGFDHPDHRNTGTDPHSLAIVPRAAATFHGGWDVIGLSGTGSIGYRIKSRALSDDFVIPHNSYTPRPESPRFTLGLVSVMITGHIAVALGLARRALMEIRDMVEVPRAAGPLSGVAGFRGEFARETARLNAARCLTLDTLAAADQAATAGTASQRHRDDVRLAAVYATEVARDVVRFAYNHAATHAATAVSPFGRVFRDMHVVTQHLLVDRNHLEPIGSRLLGIAPVENGGPN